MRREIHGSERGRETKGRRRHRRRNARQRTPRRAPPVAIVGPLVSRLRRIERETGALEQVDVLMGKLEMWSTKRRHRSETSKHRGRTLDFVASRVARQWWKPAVRHPVRSELMSIADESLDHRRISFGDVTGREEGREHSPRAKHREQSRHPFLDPAIATEERRAIGLDVDRERDRRHHRNSSRSCARPLVRSIPATNW